MNIQKYQQSLDAVNKLRNGYTQMVNGQKELVPGLNQMMQATGQFNVQTVKVTDSTNAFTKALNDNKIGLGSVMNNFSKFKQQMAEATNQQAALQRASAVSWTQSGTGEVSADVYFPKTVSSDLVDAKTKYGMIADSVNKIGTATLNWGKNTQWAGRQITAGLSMPIALAAAGIAKMAYSADTQLTDISKVYNTTTQDNQNTLQGQAEAENQLSQVRTQSMAEATAMAKEYGASVSDTLNITAQLAALGQTGQGLFDTTTQVMKVATLGDIDYNTALQMTMTLMNAFKQSGKQLGDDFNFINAVENQTSLSTKDVAEALPRVGAAMSSLGMNVQETTVLLTAFKEGGVEATQGANALKTAVARAMAPTPKAQTFFSQLGINLDDIKNGSGGDFLKYMEELSTAMQKLTPMQKETGMVDLFGIQQSNRMMAVLQNVAEITNGAIPDGFNQTATAFKLMTSGATTWAEISDQEIAQWHQSVTGKFKTSVATIQAELIKMGQPIMAALTNILSKVSGLFSWFNSLPAGIKEAGAFFAIFAAASGPILMLVGLFANLTGNVMKFVGALGRIATGFKLLDAESAAGKLLSKLGNNPWAQQDQATQILASKIGALNEVMEKQVQLQQDIITNANTAAGATNNLSSAQGNAAGMASKAAGAQQQVVTSEEEVSGAAQVELTRLEALRKAYEDLRVSGKNAADAQALVADSVSARSYGESTPFVAGSEGVQPTSEYYTPKGTSSQSLAAYQAALAQGLSKEEAQLQAAMVANANRTAESLPRSTTLPDGTPLYVSQPKNVTSIPKTGPGYQRGNYSVSTQIPATTTIGTLPGGISAKETAAIAAAQQQAQLAVAQAAQKEAEAIGSVAQEAALKGAVVAETTLMDDLVAMSEGSPSAGGTPSWISRLNPVTAIKNRKASSSSTDEVPVADYQDAEKATAKMETETEATATNSAKTGVNFGKIVTAIGGFGMGVMAIKDMTDGSGGLMSNFLDITMLAGSLGMIFQGMNVKAIWAAMSTGISKLGTEASAFSGLWTKIWGGAEKIGTSALTGLRAGLMALLTPAGATVAVVGLLAAGLYVAYEQSTKLARAQEQVNKSTDAWSKLLGYTQNTAKSLNDANNATAGGVKATQARQAAVDKLASSNGALVDQLEKIGEASKKANNMDGIYEAAMNEAIKVKVSGGSIAQAKQAFEVALTAGGIGQQEINQLDVKFDNVNLDDPSAVVASLQTDIQDSLNKLPQTDMGPSWLRKHLFGAEDSDAAKASAEKIAADFYNGIEAADGNFQLQSSTANSLQTKLNAQFKPDFNKIESDNKALFNSFSIKTMSDLYKAVTDAQNAELKGKATDNQEKLLDTVLGVKNDDGSRYGSKLTDTFNQYKAYWTQFLTQLGGLAGLKGKQLDTFVSSATAMSDTLGPLGANANEAASGLNKTGNAADDAAQKFTRLSDAIAASNNNPTINDPTQVTDAMKTAMQGAVQIATSQASTLWSRFTAQQQQAIQDASDARTKSMEDAKTKQDAVYDAQTKAAQDAATAENDAIKKKYKDLGTYYDAEIKQAQDSATAEKDSISAQIQALQKQDTARQQTFQNEQTRIQRLAQMQNNNIDFNTAVNSGNLDEAAKIFVNNQSTVEGWGLTDQQTQMDQASKAKQDALQAQSDAIDKQTTAYVNSIQTQKDALSDLQQAEEDAATKRQQAAQDALTAEKKAYDDGVTAAEAAETKKTQAAIQANQQKLEDRKTELDNEVAAITANVPATVQEEQAQVDAIQKVYKAYGVDLQTQGDSWSGIIAKGLTDKITEAGNQLQNTVKWADIGQFISDSLTQTSGISLDDMLSFLKTGNWPNTVGVPDTIKQSNGVSVPTSAVDSYLGLSGKPAGSRHNGGIIGRHSGGGVDLSGISPTQRRGYPSGAPMFSTEYLTLMEKGEYVVNKQASSQHRDLLDAINTGKPVNAGFHSGGLVGMHTGGTAGGGGLTQAMFDIAAVTALAEASVMKTVVAQAVAQKEAAQLGSLAAAGLNASDFSVPKDGMTWQTLDSIRAKLFPNSVMTSGYRPGATGPTGGKDYHNMGMAIDIGVPGNLQSGLMPIAAAIASMFPGSTELIHNPNASIKNGQTVPASFWGSSTWNEHASHVHWAMTPLALAAAAASIPKGAISAAPNSLNANEKLVQSMASAYGWGSGAEWNALYDVVMQESSFNNTAKNPTSTAYGLFQFLDATWGSYGAAKTSDASLQTKAGLAYIKSRYNDPLGALAHEQAYHWYDNGGYLMPGAAMTMNATGKPEPVFTDGQWQIMSNLVASSISQSGALAQALSSDGIASGGPNTYNVNLNVSGSFDSQIDFEKGVRNALADIEYKKGRNRKIS